MSQDKIDAIKTVPCRPKDVFVAAYPKTGVHWVHKLCTLILDHDQFLMPMEYNDWHRGHKWLGKGMGKGENGRVMYTDGPKSQGLDHDAIPDPRIMATHVPFEFLPETLEKCKVVYVTRDVKDTCVSYQEFSTKNPYMHEETLDSAVQMFAAGGSFDPAANTAAGAFYGGYMYHLKGYLDADKSGVAHVHFVNYDNLHLDPETEILKLGLSIGVVLNPTRIKEIIAKSSFQSMKQAALEAESANKGKGRGAVGAMFAGEAMEWASILYHKGVRGEGKARLSPEQCTRLDDAYADAMREVGHLFVLDKP